jgi:hypothetical protein
MTAHAPDTKSIHDSSFNKHCRDLKTILHHVPADREIEILVESLKVALSIPELEAP